jgi:flavin reductase (DIM6/NTAB) family NADH-FMN oxidoreductase RutF
MATFDTTIHREVEAGDHILVLLELHAVDHRDDGGPLLFHRSVFGEMAAALPVVGQG